MSKKIIFCLTLVVLILGFKIANASVIINEVQLDPTTDRFIELYNNGNSSVNLTNWYLQRKTATGSDFGSLVSKTYFENKTIEANSYFLISKEALGLSTFILTESNTIQLKNLEQEIVDKIGWGDGDSSVVSNPTEGKSIQKTSNNWIIASPTPGALNQTSGSTENNVNQDTTDNNGEKNDTTTTETTSKTTSSPSVSSSSSENKVKMIPVFKANILAPALAFAGQPTKFGLEIKYGSETYACGKYFWNFGDGTSMEKIGGFEKFAHIYAYPGEYNVSLEYFKNSSSMSSDITSEVVIKVVPLTVSISKVGDAKDFFVELTNNADSKIDVSNWFLSSNNKLFVLPKNTSILAKKRMTISGKISGFVLGDEKNLKLISSTGETVFDFNPPIIESQNVSEKIIKNLAQVSGVEFENENDHKNDEEKNTNTTKNGISSSDLPAIALLGSDQAGEDSNNYLFFGIFIALLLGAGSVVYFFRRKRNNPEPKIGEDFEILDE